MICDFTQFDFRTPTVGVVGVLAAFFDS